MNQERTVTNQLMIFIHYIEEMRKKVGYRYCTIEKYFNMGMIRIGYHY
ncbi:MAG: hypothetical protein V1870_03340 [Candidatus Aenigmatarchaeota archaeon]